MRAVVLALVPLACGRVGFGEVAKVAVDAPPAIDVLAPPDAAPSDLQISLTADIAYVASVGTENALLERLGSAINGLGSGDIESCPVGLGPEEWTFQRSSAPAADYLYITVWDDEELDRGWVGAIHAITGSAADVLTGDAGWQACGTADWPGGMGIVSDDRIAGHLAACNAGSSASGGWVDANGAVTPGAIGHVVVGQVQSSGVPLGPVCSDPGGVPLDAKWTWYHPTLTGSAAFVATGSDDDLGMLLFRHPI